MEWRSMGLGVRTLAAEERIAALEAALTDARTPARRSVAISLKAPLHDLDLLPLPRATITCV